MTNATAAQIENMKAQTFGVEVEMNSITRENAAKAAAAYFGTGRWENTAHRNGYCTVSAYDADGREWKFSKDVSIAGPDSEKTEMVTPVLHYADMELLQGLIRALRKAGGRSCASRGCGVHIHIGGDGHTPKTVRNLVNLMASHEDQLTKAIRIDGYRQARYCKTVDPAFLERINKQKPATTAELARCWYNGPVETEHYSYTRYRMLNLHSYFNRYHTIEFRCFNFDEKSEGKQGGLHAGQLKAMIQLCLAMSQMAKQLRSASPKKGQRDNEAYGFRCWMLRLGFIGDEFKTAREYFMRNFEGSSAWRNGR
ncbi:MAG: amidoligase family protein [Blautia sp.]|nr:amidoligase family protein [Blautia sp.]